MGLSFCSELLKMLGKFIVPLMFSAYPFSAQKLSVVTHLMLHRDCDTACTTPY